MINQTETKDKERAIANKTEDLVLIEAIKKGSKRESKKAFETLFYKYYKPVLFNLKGKLNEVDAEDVTMTLFTKLHSKIEIYDENAAAFNTWLFTLSRNAFIDFLRKRKMNTIEINSHENEDGNVKVFEFEDHSTLTPDKVLIKKEKDALLKSIIARTLKTKPNLKELIEMRYFDELSYDEMASLTSLPLGTVKAQLHRAKKMLQQPCEKHGLKM